MKKHKWMRRVSLLLTLVLLSMTLMTPASAYDWSLPEGMPPVEIRPDWTPPTAPQWTEQEVTCQSGENTLRGTLTIPDNVEGQMPMAVLFHGLNTDRHWCDGIAWILADHGIASVRFDYAGNGLSDGEQWEMTVSSLTQDTRAIINYVRDLAITDPDNIFAVGKSMGAVATMMASYAEGDYLKAVCMWYPGFSVKDMARHGWFLGEMINPWFPPPFIEVEGFTYGHQFLKEIQIMDYETACQEYEGKVMILHGTDDIIVPLFSSFQAEPLFQDCTLQVVPGGGHGFYGFQEHIALNSMVAFFEAQIQ